MNSQKRLLLTGGSGMVGRNVLDHPAAANWDIVAPRSADLDLTDRAAVDAYMAKAKPDLVIHAAGRVGGIHANIANPVAFLDDNLLMGRNVIMAARQTGVKQLINLGSTCMYPREAVNPLVEDSILTQPLEPTNEGYALAKIMAARLCDYIRTEDASFAYKTLIPCNLYGAHDKFDPRHSHLVPAIIHKVHHAKKNGIREVEIWGDGTARREFLFAADLADAILKAAEDVEGLAGAMNIGLGHDHSINDYYTIVAEVIGWEGRFVHDLSKPVGMKQKLCSVAKQTEWGWKAPTALRDGLARTYQYYLESGHS